MARFTALLLTLTLAACQFGVDAAPLGNLKCNLARLKTVSNLNAATKAVDSMADVAVNSNDATMADAITEAQGGLTDATTGVQGIADALRANQAAPAALRDQTLDGLTTAQTALGKIQATSGAAASPLKQAKAKVAAALAAGQQVVSNCPGGTDAANGTASASATATDAAAATATDATAGAADSTADAAATSSAAPATTAKGNNAQTKAGKTDKRQIGGIKCNVARLQTVSNLAASSNAVKKVATAAASDATTADAAQTAQTGLTGAKGGIATIAKSLLTGQAAPAAARTQVLDGLNAAKTALSGITSTDPAVTSAVTAAQSKIDATLTAGGKVVDNC